MARQQPRRPRRMRLPTMFAPLLLRGIAGVILLWRRIAANGRLRGCVVRWRGGQMRGGIVDR